MRRMTIGMSAALLGVFASVAWADTVRLKNGRTIEGHVVREDQAQIIIAVSGGSEVVAASDVASISYSDLRFTPRPPSDRALAPPTEAAAVDTALLDRIRTRLLAVRRYLKQTQRVAGLLAQGKPAAAGAEARAAAQHLLPTTSHGAFSPLSALADLVILLGFRSTLLWLALVLVKERRSFTRITEFLLLGYCLIMLLMAVIGLACSQILSFGLWLQLIGIPLLAAILMFLFLWIFTLGVRKGLVAITLAVVLSVGSEHLLLASSR